MNKKPIKIPSYIKKQLLPDEYVIYKLKPSWKIWIGPAGLFLIILFALFSKIAENEEMIVFLMCFVALFIFSFLMVLYEYLKFLVLTNKMVIIKSPYEDIKISLEDINGIAMFLEMRGNKLPWSIYSIQFICKKNKKIIRNFTSISEEDYNKFKKLLTEECKKHGNNIS